MKQTTSQTLYSYWNDVRQNRPAPRRFEIEPSHIASILAYTFILERIDSETFRYRLAGTGLSEMFRRELRDENFLRCFDDASQPAVERLLTTVTLHCGAGVVEFDVTAGSNSVGMEAILLPLVHTRGGVDRVLGAVSPVSAAEWLGSEVPSPWQLTGSSVHWPDGHPLPAMNTLDRQEPFLPHIRKARIVRSDRRQFRVYDGGLSEPTKN